MSAEILRRAAALMRERADGCGEDGPWTVGTYAGETAVLADAGTVWIARTGFTGDALRDAQHVASWDPAVALAVADWLDGIHDAVTNPDAENSGITTLREESAALAVARAYLGESA